MSKAGRKILKGAEEALAIARGDADASTYRVFVPPSIDVKEIRHELEMTQEEFANSYGFQVATVRDWEQGRSNPIEHSRAYLMVIQNEPKAVEKALRKADEEVRVGV